MITIKPSTTHSNIAAYRQTALNLLLITVWGWLYWPLRSYLSIIFSREDFRTNQIILVGVLILIGIQIKKEGSRFDIKAAPRPTFWPMILMIGGSILYLLVERFLNVNTLSASLFGVASYGLLGLWISPQRWRTGLPAALLLVGTLPFGEHMQTFIGYPMRILTASIVQNGLAASGVGSIGVDTILIFENGVSHIDSPCSGVKSLWTGMLFLLAATWLERRQINGHWVKTAVIFTLLLFIANLARVAILIIVGEIFGWPFLAEMLHIPLGVIGFVMACVAAVFMLKNQLPMVNGQLPMTIDQLPNWITSMLIVVISIMAILYTPRPITVLSQKAATWKFPVQLTVTPLPLKPDENEWLTKDGAEAADRFQFKWQGANNTVSGTMILITSKTWRAHHRPERCFEVYGLSLDESRTHLVSSDFPVRFVSLGQSGGNRSLTATYWFQSNVQTTDDYGTRIWSDISPQRERWVLVSILFDEVADPNSEEIAAFYQAMNDAVAQHLTATTDP
ncbi:MAG: exosortase O [Chloroflexi bacterium]|nr:exosortase O [Chloroflexota bacterium]